MPRRPLIDINARNIRDLSNFFRKKSAIYRHIARTAIERGFKSFSPYDRMIYKKEMISFLENHDNISVREYNVLKNVQIMHSRADIMNKVGRCVFILYRIINKKKKFMHKDISYVSELELQTGIIDMELELQVSKLIEVYFSREKYFNASFGGEKGTHIHLDIRALGDPNKFNEEFDFQILCVANSREKIKTLKKLFTIYENWLNLFS